MRFYTKTHKHYCGVDLHARSMYVCIMNQEGTVFVHRNLPCDPVRFLAKCPEGRAHFAPIEHKHGKAKMLSILAHMLGRAASFMLARKCAFDLERFLRS